MADGSRTVSLGQTDEALVFSLAGDRYALPVACVDAIMPLPSLCRVPHAPPQLLGVGNAGGHALPVFDLAEILPGCRARGRAGTEGEVLRLRAAGGSVGVRVDRVERVVERGAVAAHAITVIDPERLIAAAMATPKLAAELHNPLGDAAAIAGELAEMASAATCFMVEAAGVRVRLPRELVLEFTGAPPQVQVPRAPAGLLGVGILRGEPLPIVSLAVLLDLPQSRPPGNFAIIALAGRRLMLGFDRIIGLRTVASAIADAGEDGRTFDPVTAIPEALRVIIAGFVPSGAAPVRSDGVAAANGGATYLCFIIGGERYALPVAAVDRVVSHRPLIALPQLNNGCHDDAVVGAIELRSQVIPVTRLDNIAASVDTPSGAVGPEPGAYVIVCGTLGMTAIAAQRIDRLVTLRPDQIATPPGNQTMIDGVAVLDDRGDLLRILAPDRLTGGC